MVRASEMLRTLPSSIRCTMVVALGLLTAPRAALADSAAATAANPAEHSSLEATLPEAARANFDIAMILYEAGDFSGALLKFELAYNQSSDPRLLWDLAVCERDLRHYARALPLVHRYLTEAATLINASERQQAEDLAELVGKLVGPVRIESSQSGATVMIDDQTLGKTPLPKAVMVDIGNHKVTVTKRGYKDAATNVRVTGPGSEQKIHLVMDRDIPAATLEVVAGAEQWISLDDGIVGRTRWEGLVSQGKHLIKVTGNGYKPKEVEADLSNGGRVSVWVVAEPADSVKSGNLWPWVAVIGGATVAAGVVAYFVLRPDEKRAPAPVVGGLDTLPVGFVTRGWP
jgi:hypothetical protein